MAYNKPGPAGDDAERARAQERRQRAIHLKVVAGMNWTAIARELGYYDGTHARRDIEGELKRQTAQVTRGLELLVHQQDIRYDYMRQQTMSIMLSDHPLIQNGKIVKDDQGRPVKDVGPRLAALQTMLRIEKQWAELHGTEASKKLEIALETRTDLESNLVAEAVLAAAEALGLEPAQRMRALEAAAARLDIVDAEVVSEDPPE